jgi:hypothetical protein
LSGVGGEQTSSTMAFSAISLAASSDWAIVGAVDAKKTPQIIATLPNAISTPDYG